MSAIRLAFFFGVWSTILASCHAQPALDVETEALVNQLPRVTQEGYGYSTMFAGSQFLPDKQSSSAGMFVLGVKPPADSLILEKIVRQGAKAVPPLLKHLDDARTTKIPPLRGMMWMKFSNEYDFNRCLRKDWPTGVNIDDFGASGNNEPTTHTVTVGDLCFVALGQIVNREFNATRYQATGGMIISSPTYSKRLCEVARADFQDFNATRHRDSLIQDFEKPDYGGRRVGAYRRLAFYYSDACEPLLLSQLKVPTYDTLTVDDFVEKNLYKEKSADKRKLSFENFTRRQGRAYADGIKLRLFNDLPYYEEKDPKKMTAFQWSGLKARSLLAEMFGFDANVTRKDWPYIDTWSTNDCEGLIEALKGLKNTRVDKAVSGLLTTITDDDYLAIACAGHLIQKGYDRQIRAYCERRIPKSDTYDKKQLQNILAQLDARKQARTTAPKKS
jgi:hypothetical protein